MGVVVVLQCYTRPAWCPPALGGEGVHHEASEASMGVVVVLQCYTRPTARCPPAFGCEGVHRVPQAP